jgi:hypothetical protein
LHRDLLVGQLQRVGEVDAQSGRRRGSRAP